MWESEELEMARKYLTPEEFSLVNGPYGSAHFTNLDQLPDEDEAEADELTQIKTVKHYIESKLEDLYEEGYLSTPSVHEAGGYLAAAEQIDEVLGGLMDKAEELEDAETFGR